MSSADEEKRTQEARDAAFKHLDTTGQLLTLKEIHLALYNIGLGYGISRLRYALRYDRRVNQLRVPTGVGFSHDYVYFSRNNPKASALARKVKEKLHERTGRTSIVSRPETAGKPATGS